MGSYTIEQVTGPNLWNGPNGAVNFFDLKLQGVAEVVGLGQKPERPAPVVGQQIDLTLEPDPRKPGKLKGKREQQGGFGGPRQEDPKRSAVILRQHSQEMSLRYAQIRQAQGQLPAEFSLTDLWKIADQFDEDARKAKEAA